MNSYEDFFSWCELQGLISDREIAYSFSRTPQTVRNWKRSRVEHGNGAPPKHLALECEGYEFSRRGGRVPSPPKVNLEWFNTWCAANGLDTLESTGDAFGITRQAVHNWRNRGRLPKWLQLASIGYEQRKTHRVTSNA